MLESCRSPRPRRPVRLEQFLSGDFRQRHKEGPVTIWNPNLRPLINGVSLERAAAGLGDGAGAARFFDDGLDRLHDFNSYGI